MVIQKRNLILLYLQGDRIMRRCFLHSVDQSCRMLKHIELNCRDIKGPCTICICGYHPAGMVLVYRQMKVFRFVPLPSV